MKKVAMLVTFSFVTRVIVDEDASEEDIVNAAKEGIQEKVNNDELWDNLDKIEEDEECPYSEEDE